jgi:hypothetical protein
MVLKTIFATFGLAKCLHVKFQLFAFTFQLNEDIKRTINSLDLSKTGYSNFQEGKHGSVVPKETIKKLTILMTLSNPSRPALPSATRTV